MMRQGRATKHKSLQTDCVIFMPGPDQEVVTVLQMFTWFIHEDLPLAEIANRLNA